jgi:hypothetical protein
MITNISRQVFFQECRRKSYNWDELRLMPHREANPLIYGSAVHEGIAEFLAKRDPRAAVALTEFKFRERLATQVILPEERGELEQMIEQSRRMVAQFAQNYSESEMQVIWPEVEFCVPLPNTDHHCYFFHKLLFPNIPFDECKDYGIPTKAGPYWDPVLDRPRCWQPHYFQGKTDAVVSWKNAIWLLEHKTTAYTGSIFYDRFFLDFQPTGYLYGIGKALGTTPHGFILNVLKKPTKTKKDQLDVGFEREYYLRSDEDLAEFESELIEQATDYENTFVRRSVHGITAATYKNTKSCTNWNRRCYFWESCKRHEPLSLEPNEQYKRRPLDYVQKKYYEMLGIDPPAEQCEQDPNLNLIEEV